MDRGAVIIGVVWGAYLAFCIVRAICNPYQPEDEGETQ